MSRSKIQIDPNRVEELAAQGLSQAEICATLAISEDTLTRRKRDSAVFPDALKRGKSKAAATISNKLFELATGGNVTAIIWWEKTRAGFSDRMKSEITVRQTFEDFVAMFATAQTEPPANGEAAQRSRATHAN